MRINIHSIRGMSLIELMIVVTIVGILAGIGYPAYQGHAIKSHRSDAHTSLLEGANRMEKYFLDYNTYTTSMIDLGYATASPASPQSYYFLGVAAGATGSIASSYYFGATVDASSGQKADTDCWEIIFSSNGDKTSFNKTGGASSGRCW